jgi:hypothetical protein
MFRISGFRNPGFHDYGWTETHQIVPHPLVEMVRVSVSHNVVELASVRHD